MAYGSFEDGGITVSSSELTNEQLAANLTPVVDDTVVESDDEAPAVAVIEPKVEAKPNPRKDPQARVEAATAKEAAAKRERDEAKAEATKLQARIAELEAKALPKIEPTPTPAPVTADPEPTVDQFDSYEKFVKAQARWEARQEIRAQETERTTHAANQQREHVNREIDRQFSERYQAILAEDPAFPGQVDPRLLNTPRAGVLADPSTATFGNFLVEQVFQSEQPKALLLYFSDPANVQRLATLPPAQMIRELARIEFGAAPPAAPAPITPAVSHAKPPTKPVGSSPVAADPNDLTGDESVDEHIRKMNAVERRARRAS